MAERPGEGKLKIFLGYAAGVGKTYQMLEEAQELKRQGRDVIALESTPAGFDLYLCDSPNGSADYAVTIAIPRKH